MKWLVPRIGDGESSAAARLRAEGHEVVEVTVGRIVPLPVVIPPCEWLILTSRHAVPACSGSGSSGPCGSPRLAVIGEATAAAARAAGLAVSFLPSRPDSATLLSEIVPQLKPSDRVVRLKPRHAPDSLSALAGVCAYATLDAYENVAVPLDPIDLSAYDAAFFTCSSSVERVFAVSTGATSCHAIGPSTQSALKASLSRRMDASSLPFHR